MNKLETLQFELRQLKDESNALHQKAVEAKTAPDVRVSLYSAVRGVDEAIMAKRKEIADLMAPKQGRLYPN